MQYSSNIWLIVGIRWLFLFKSIQACRQIVFHFLKISNRNLYHSFGGKMRFEGISTLFKSLIAFVLSVSQNYIALR